MKTKLFLLALLFFISFTGFSQNADDFLLLQKRIHALHPEIDFTDKIVFISFWKSSDFASREINQEAYRVYKIYEKAKLKNGEKGTVFISINEDADAQSMDIAIKKDGVDANVVYTDSSLIELIKARYNVFNSQDNIILDKSGLVQYKNLTKDQMFISMRNLITR